MSGFFHTLSVPIKGEDVLELSTNENTACACVLGRSRPSVHWRCFCEPRDIELV